MDGYANYRAAKDAYWVSSKNVADITKSELGQLARAVEDLHNCNATYRGGVSVSEDFQGETVWEGVVHIFDIQGHSDATVAYAWHSPVEDSNNRKYFAVLHIPPIDSPESAIRAAIVAEYRWASQQGS